ncbi:hypothetical protein FB45DRAFT_1006229 [Roridomyces roridus]|uniref:Uncharacterized protein n=1 Tax=Roridomyces roridus TaxID=1738132 RepID=A0AAD7FIE7_9AGAR|nr:hypothetical protein FB45DRAFT_1006229 [Roridomyces roridus]
MVYKPDAKKWPQKSSIFCASNERVWALEVIYIDSPSSKEPYLVQSMCGDGKLGVVVGSKRPPDPFRVRLAVGRDVDNTEASRIKLRTSKARHMPATEVSERPPKYLFAMHYDFPDILASRASGLFVTVLALPRVSSHGVSLRLPLIQPVRPTLPGTLSLSLYDDSTTKMASSQFSSLSPDMEAVVLVVGAVLFGILIALFMGYTAFRFSMAGSDSAPTPAPRRKAVEASKTTSASIVEPSARTTAVSSSLQTEEEAIPSTRIKAQSRKTKKKNAGKGGAAADSEAEPSAPVEDAGESTDTDHGWTRVGGGAKGRRV